MVNFLNTYFFPQEHAAGRCAGGRRRVGGACRRQLCDGGCPGAPRPAVPPPRHELRTCAHSALHGRGAAGGGGEQALSVSVGYDGTLVAVGTNKSSIHFFDKEKNMTR